MFVESYCQGLFKGILYFKFGEKIFELYANEGFKSTYFIYHHMLISFEKSPPKSERVVSNTLEIPLNASRIQETFKGIFTCAYSKSLKLSWIT
jgi:hypothetical protein